MTKAEQLQALVSPQAIHEMREWITDCDWADLPHGDIQRLTVGQVLLGVDRAYSGGVDQFIRDGA